MNPTVIKKEASLALEEIWKKATGAISGEEEILLRVTYLWVTLQKIVPVLYANYFLPTQDRGYGDLSVLCTLNVVSSFYAQ